MDGIQKSSRRIADITGLIDSIAFQTNILALNAAVEAARAGDAGAGFAVVAGEVRSLALRSAQSARDTAALIEESTVRSLEGTTKVAEVASAITATAANMTRLKAIVEGVQAASQQQTQGIERVTQTFAQIERVTQATAANSEESAAASEELNAHAESTLAIVQQLALLVGGIAAAATPTDRVAPDVGRRPGASAERVLRSSRAIGGRYRPRPSEAALQSAGS
jgi:methyl-accepting chemotaxis protein